MSAMPPDQPRPPAETAELSPDQALAMDYALGALSREDRQASQLRLRSDEKFRAEVEHWQSVLGALDGETAPVLPPASVWQGVLGEITPAAPRGPVAAPAPIRRPGLWNSLPLWRGLGLGAPALAALALVIANPNTPPVMIRTPASTPPASASPATPALLAASLADADGKPLLAATFDPLRGTVVLTPATTRSDGDSVPELWVIEGDAPPRSLGVISIDAPNAHAISSQRISGLQPGAVLAISIEPTGGSPTGLPTGPVIATGKLSAV
ncbi:anti-sigma factor [Polymorphobacter sp.]|uniref:anti-sigma factor n=1 Tax=Polymorphobacter sp. TaxID=1909290 RepID=UPI003F6F88D6